MAIDSLDRRKFVAGDASAHAGFLNCERLSDRSHIHRWRVEPHYHEGLAQLFVFDRGIVGGVVEFKPIRTSGPAIVWVPALCQHAFDYPDDMLGWVITVPSVNVARLLDGRAWLQRWIASPQLLLSGAGHDAVAEGRDWALRILAEAHRDGDDRFTVLEALFLLLLVTVHRGLTKQAGEESTGSRHPDLALRFQKLLDEDGDPSRSVRGYADLLAVTPTHLSRSVKAVMGRTAGDLIHDRILLEAKRRLAFTDAAVAEIAYQLDFSSASYFSRFFAARSGETPTDFRNRSRRRAWMPG